MNAPLHNPLHAPRRSPFADAWGALSPECVDLNGMRVPARFPAGRLPPIALADASFLPRTGVKGEGAAAWLQARGIPLPPRHNQWVAHQGGVVARLGNTEFLLESGAEPDWTLPLRAQDDAPAGVVPVLREDASLLLCGARLNELLVQVCSFDFPALEAAARPLVMTQMIGVSVLVIAVPGAAVPAYRLWCDPSFATYLWRTLAQIAGELGGAPLGWPQLAGLGLPPTWD